MVTNLGKQTRMQRFVPVRRHREEPQATWRFRDTSHAALDSKTARRDVQFGSLDCAALVPNPRLNLTRYHSVFAPNHHPREQVTPLRRGRRHTARAQEPPVDRHAAIER